MVTAIIMNEDGSINVGETLKKLDKGIMYCVEEIKKLTVGTTADDRNREFVYKTTDGTFKGANINLDKPICPICNNALDPLTLSKEVLGDDGKVKYPSSPRGYCKIDKVYFNFSNRNMKGFN